MTHELDFPSTVPELVGDRVRLRALTDSDIPAWHARATDAESADLAGDPIPASMDEGLGTLGLREVQAEVLQRNLASVHLLDTMGFQRVRSVPAEESADGEAFFPYRLRAAPTRAA